MVQSAGLTVLYRRRVSAATGGDIEVYLAERSPELSFLGGHFVFPGGRIDAGDKDLPARVSAERSPEERKIRSGTLRELFEETGILVTDPPVAACDQAVVEAARATRVELLERGATGEPLRRFLKDHSLELDLERLRPLTRLVTPRFSRRRFDSVFHLLECDQEPEIIRGELVSGQWLTPAAALSAWRRRDLRIAAPGIALLEELAALPLEDAARELGRLSPEFERSGRYVAIAPGYDLVPLETPPLGPNIPTNTMFVGADRFIVVDCGACRQAEKEHLVAALRRRLATGGTCDAVVLTHHHPDHVGGLQEVLDAFQLPVWAHSITGELIQRRLDRTLNDGSLIELGASPDGRTGWTLQALFTPGHAAGHIALFDERYRSLIAGDLVSTLMSMYVGSPGGNLNDYFSSLKRVLKLDVETLYPSHGMPTLDAKALLRETLEHRYERLEQVAAALSSTPCDVATLAAEIYGGVSRRLSELTIRATRAALKHLASLGRAREVETDSFVVD